MQQHSQFLLKVNLSAIKLPRIKLSIKVMEPGKQVISLQYWCYNTWETLILWRLLNFNFTFLKVKLVLTWFYCSSIQISQTTIIADFFKYVRILRRHFTLGMIVSDLLNMEEMKDRHEKHFRKEMWTTKLCHYFYHEKFHFLK